MHFWLIVHKNHHMHISVMEGKATCIRLNINM